MLFIPAASPTISSGYTIPIGKVNDFPRTVPPEIEKSVSQTQWQAIVKLLRIANDRAAKCARNTIINTTWVLPCAACFCWAGEAETARIRQYRP